MVGVKVIGKISTKKSRKTLPRKFTRSQLIFTVLCTKLVEYHPNIRIVRNVQTKRSQLRTNACSFSTNKECKCTYEYCHLGENFSHARCKL